MVSDKIFEELKKKGMTQKAFSQETGIAESTICDWKRKGLNPSIDKLPSICRALGISASELLGIDDGSDRIRTLGPDYTAAPGENRVDTEVRLNDNEKTLIELYRHADPGTAKRMLEYMTGIIEAQQSAGRGASPPAADSVYQGSAEVIEPDTDFLVKKQLARRIRRLARLDRIKLDESEHASGLNLHLFKYLDYVGLDKLEFVKEYLRNIQPFMLAEIKSQEKWDNAICVLDEFYRISIYIKIDASIGDELIVSFHENNKNGIAKRNPLTRSSEYVYVFADSIGSRVIGTDSYTINIFITRGVKTFPINIAAKKYDDDLFRVRFRDISQNLLEYANNYLSDLYTSDMDFDGIELFSSLQQLSFTSYGNDVFSNISILIDSLLLQRDTDGKRLADGALCIYCASLDLPASERTELIETLHGRFSVNSVKALPQILERVEMNLQ